MGMSQLDPSIGGLLKNLGYATGQFGQNHVGDRNPSLPTVNGFDEFFGNLYHPERRGRSPNCQTIRRTRNISRNSGFRAASCTAKATDVDDPTDDPRFGKVGKQTIEDTGALTKKRMETIDDETSAAAIDFMKRQQTASKAVLLLVQLRYPHASAHAYPRQPPRQPLHARATANISTA